MKIWSAFRAAEALESPGGFSATMGVSETAPKLSFLWTLSFDFFFEEEEDGGVTKAFAAFFKLLGSGDLARGADLPRTRVSGGEDFDMVST